MQNNVLCESFQHNAQIRIFKKVHDANLRRCMAQEFTQRSRNSQRMLRWKFKYYLIQHLETEKFKMAYTLYQHYLAKKINEA